MLKVENEPSQAAPASASANITGEPRQDTLGAVASAQATHGEGSGKCPQAERTEEEALEKRTAPTSARTTCRSRRGASRPPCRGYSRNPERGISARDQDAMSFKADQIGEFLWFCGVSGHGQSGMWMRFTVTDETETPYITVTADAEPGRF